MKTIEVDDETYEALNDMLDPDIKTPGDAVSGLVKLVWIQTQQISEMRGSLRMIADNSSDRESRLVATMALEPKMRAKK